MKIISKGDICLKIISTKEKACRSISLGGVIILMVTLGNSWLEKTKNSLAGLPENTVNEISFLLSKEANESTRKANLKVVPINYPKSVPWKCNRCKANYKKKLKAAKRHAEADACLPKKVKQKYFIAPFKHVTNIKTVASHRQQNWTHHVANIATTHLKHLNFLKFLTNNPYCHDCFKIKDGPTYTTTPHTDATPILNFKDAFRVVFPFEFRRTDLLDSGSVPCIILLLGAG